MSDLSHPGRRGFLRRSIAIVPAATALTATGFVTAQNATAPTAPPPGTPPSASANAPYTPVYFHADEWTFINAAVARLIPSDDVGPGAIEAGVPEFIEDKMFGVIHNAVRDDGILAWQQFRTHLYVPANFRDTNNMKRSYHLDGRKTT